MSQVLTTPCESIEKAKPSLVCRLTALIGAEVREIDSESSATWSSNKAPTCQNLIELSLDAEMRVKEEAKARE